MPYRHITLPSVGTQLCEFIFHTSSQFLQRYCLCLGLPGAVAMVAPGTIRQPTPSRILLEKRVQGPQNRLAWLIRSRVWMHSPTLVPRAEDTPIVQATLTLLVYPAELRAVLRHNTGQAKAPWHSRMRRIPTADIPLRIPRSIPPILIQSPMADRPANCHTPRLEQVVVWVLPLLRLINTSRKRFNTLTIILLCHMVNSIHRQHTMRPVLINSSRRIMSRRVLMAIRISRGSMLLSEQRLQVIPTLLLSNRPLFRHQTLDMISQHPLPTLIRVMVFRTHPPINLIHLQP